MYRFTDITVLVRKGVVFTEGVDAGFRKSISSFSQSIHMGKNDTEQ